MLHCLRRDDRAATLPEFALLCLPLCVLLMGGLDMAYQIYTRAVILGSLERASRMTSVETVDTDAIETAIDNEILKVVPNASISITKGSFYQYSDINKMERLTHDRNGNDVLDGPVDTNGDGVPDSPDCWEDVDNNNERNVVTTGRTGIGGADDIVRYNVAVTYPRLLPMYGLIGLPAQVHLDATTFIKRQPYEGQATPPEKCAT